MNRSTSCCHASRDLDRYRVLVKRSSARWVEPCASIMLYQPLFVLSP